MVNRLANVEQVLTRSDAMRVGSSLLERGHVQHVAGEHKFKDEELYYRFFDDTAAVNYVGRRVHVTTDPGDVVPLNSPCRFSASTRPARLLTKRVANFDGSNHPPNESTKSSPDCLNAFLH